MNVQVHGKDPEMNLRIRRVWLQRLHLPTRARYLPGSLLRGTFPPTLPFRPKLHLTESIGLMSPSSGAEIHRVRFTPI